MNRLGAIALALMLAGVPAVAGGDPILGEAAQMPGWITDSHRGE